MQELPNLKLLIPYFLCIGALTAYVAHNKRGRKPLPWFFLGFFFGLLGLVALFLLPKKNSVSTNQPTSLSPVKPVKSYPMTKELWYFLDKKGNQIGPMSFNALKNNYIQGDLSKSSYVWNASLEKWTTLNELNEYITLLEKQPEIS